MGVSGLCPDQVVLWSRHRDGGATKHILSRSLVLPIEWAPETKAKLVWPCLGK